MTVTEVLEKRISCKYFDQDNYPSKDTIEEILKTTHRLCPSKQNLMPYKIKVLGPEKKHIKEEMYRISSENEYPDPDECYEKRIRRLESNQYVWGNSQLFAPWVLIWEKRIPEANQLVKDKMELRQEPYGDLKHLQDDKTDGPQFLESGMFLMILSMLCLEKNISLGYTGCLNFRKLRLFPFSENSAIVSVGLGYPDTNVEERYRYNRYRNVGEDKPDFSEIVQWVE